MMGEQAEALSLTVPKQEVATCGTATVAPLHSPPPPVRIHDSDSTTGTPLLCSHCDYQTLDSELFHEHVLGHSVQGVVAADNHGYTNGNDNCSALVNGSVGAPGDTGVMNFNCDQCHYSTFNIANLKSHEKMHENAKKSFSCDICHMRFSQAANMRRHRMRHTGFKPFECRVCSKRFFRKDHLSEHMGTHSKGQQFQCPICQKTFARQYHLKMHKAEHAGEDAKRCYVCGLACPTLKHLKLHYSRAHNLPGRKEVPPSPPPPPIPAIDRPPSMIPPPLSLIDSHTPMRYISLLTNSVMDPSSSPPSPMMSLLRNHLNNNTSSSDNPPPTLDTPTTSTHSGSNGSASPKERLEIDTTSNSSNQESREIKQEPAECIDTAGSDTTENSQPPENSQESPACDKEDTDKPLECVVDKQLESSPNIPDNHENQMLIEESEQVSLEKVTEKEPPEQISVNMPDMIDLSSTSGALRTHSPHSQTNKLSKVIARITQPLYRQNERRPEKVSTFTQDTLLKCPFCGILYLDQTLYFLHKALHSENHPWRCNVCGTMCRDKYDFNSHILSKAHE